MSSNDNHSWAILAYFNPCEYEFDETKKMQNHSIRSQITFGIKLQAFPQHCNTRKLQHATWPTDKTNQSNEQRSCIHHYQKVSWVEHAMNGKRFIFTLSQLVIHQTSLCCLSLHGGGCNSWFWTRTRMSQKANSRVFLTYVPCNREDKSA